MTYIIDKEYYNIKSTEDMNIFYQRLKVDLICHSYEQGEQIYSDSFVITPEAQQRARNENKTILEYAIESKVQEREKMLHNARFDDALNTSNILVACAEKDSINFRLYHCTEEVLRDLMVGECNIYLDSNYRCTIDKKNKVYCPFKLTNMGNSLYRHMIENPTYKNKLQQTNYMISTLLLDRSYLQEIGWKWYYGDNKNNKNKRNESQR